jgi:predicted nucleic acid-binding protein
VTNTKRTVPFVFRAVQYVTEFSRSHSVTMADALIAATVIEKSDILFTANTKHFRCIPGMTLKTFRA